MKRTLRCISIVLALMMVFSGVAQADEAMPCASSYITLYGASLEKTTTTWFKVWFEVVGTDIMDELGTCSIEVQRSSNGIDGWTTMRTYLSEDYAQMICKNTACHAENVMYYTGTPGYYYRAYVTFWAKDSTGSAKIFYYTPVMQL